MAKTSFAMHHKAAKQAFDAGNHAQAMSHIGHMLRAVKTAGAPPSSPSGAVGIPDTDSPLATDNDQQDDTLEASTAQPTTSPSATVGGSMSSSGPQKPEPRGLGNWMQGAVKHPGALHKELGVPQGQKIPAKKVAAAADSSNPLEAKRARLAQTFARFRGK